MVVKCLKRFGGTSMVWEVVIFLAPWNGIVVEDERVRRADFCSGERGWIGFMIRGRLTSATRHFRIPQF
jgi:hypothetical protein